MTANDITVVLDERIKGFVETGGGLVVDYRETAYGSGFIVEGGSTC